MFLEKVRLTLFHSCVMRPAPAERKACVFEKGKLVVGSGGGGGGGGFGKAEEEGEGVRGVPDVEVTARWEGGWEGRVKWGKGEVARYLGK